MIARGETGSILRTDCELWGFIRLFVVFASVVETRRTQHTLHHKVRSPTGTMADVPLLVVSENSSAERRITPSWSISTLKAKLETVTGIPPSYQRIQLKTGAEGSVPVEASDEDSTQLTAFRLTAYAELHVSDFPLWLRKRSLFLHHWLFR